MFDDGGRIRVFVHPDWVGRGLRGYDVVEGPSVFPLSSSRTVQLGLSEYALKLAYPGMLGRISRSMTEEHIGLALEVSGILESKVAEGGCLGLMDFMPKLCGVVFRRGSFETGYAVRGHARCMLDEPSYPVLPAFALTSVDKGRPSDPPLLCQIMARKEDAASWLAGNLLLPLTDVFFACVFDEGLLLEMHSQNVLVQFDSCWDVRKIILRDLESADKDRVIRRALKGKPPLFIPSSHKCLLEKGADYLKRHSFMYDHKLGEYLLGPLTECAASFLGGDPACLGKSVAAYVRRQWGSALDDFFPCEHRWYKYPDGEIDRSTSRRNYRELPDPHYR